MNYKEYTPMKLLFITMTICALVCSGCGNSDKVELGTVTGVITMDGKPLADAVVVFAPSNEGNPSSGRTDTNGKYELIYLGNAKGAIVGNHKVNITTGQPLETEIDGNTDLSNSDLAATTEVDTPPLEDADVTRLTPMQRAATKSRKKDPIPAKYNTKTTLTADVKSGENTFDFKLDSK